MKGSPSIRRASDTSVSIADHTMAPTMTTQAAPRLPRLTPRRSRRCAPSPPRPGSSGGPSCATRPRLEPDDAPAIGLGELEHVERRHHRDAVLLVDPAQELHHGVGQRGVEARHRLVGQDHRRLLEQGPRDGDALLLAARECVHAAIGEAVETHPRQDGVGPRDLGVLEPASERPPARCARERAEQRVLQHGEPALKVELLEHEADARAHPPQRLRRGAGHHVVADPHLAAGRDDEAVQAAQESGLARPARPDEGHELTRGDVEIHSVQRARPARVVLAQPADADHRRPAVKWKWTWYTTCPPSGPVLQDTR